RAVTGGALVGLSIGLAFLLRGFLAPVAISITALVLPVFKAWRRPRYVVAIVVALAVAIPLCAAWPLALYLKAPAYFDDWLPGVAGQHSFGLPAFPPPREPLYYLKNLPWLAWPAVPLALWTFVARMRGYNGGWSTAGIQLPLTLTIVLLAIISFGAE